MGAEQNKPKGGAGALVPWRGDEHRLALESATEVGLDVSNTSVESFTRGFTAGMVIEDPYDGAIVARGRTVLAQRELAKTLRPILTYLGVARDAVRLAVHDGSFELRLSKDAADASKPALDSAKLALQVWVGFGLLGLGLLQFAPQAVASVVWGLGLLLGAWQLRRGLASGRAMLGARLAMALGMLAHEEQLILPPSESSTSGVGP